jgi:drug/metabolite transporter superfamily protein YnfA
MNLQLGDRLSIGIRTERTDMNRVLIAFGSVFIIAGLLWPWLKRIHLFHLPGDIIIDRPGFKFMFPITTMLIVSAVLSLIAWLMRR